MNNVRKIVAGEIYESGRTAIAQVNVAPPPSKFAMGSPAASLFLLALLRKPSGM